MWWGHATIALRLVLHILTTSFQKNGFTETNLPSDILIHIIKFLSRLEYPKDKGSMFPPMAVSRHWRLVALWNPSLWQKINITQQYYKNEFDIGSFNTWLDRSGCLPLEVHVDLRADNVFKAPPLPVSEVYT